MLFRGKLFRLDMSCMTKILALFEAPVGLLSGTWLKSTIGSAVSVFGITAPTVIRVPMDNLDYVSYGVTLNKLDPVIH